MTKAAPFLVNLIPSPTPGGIGDLPLRASNPSAKTVHPQFPLLLDRCHLPLQRHPHPIEHPRRYPVPTQVRALQRCRQTASRDLSKQLALHPGRRAQHKHTASRRPTPGPRPRNRGRGSDTWRSAALLRSPTRPALGRCLCGLPWLQHNRTRVRSLSAERRATMDGKDRSIGPSTTITYCYPLNREQLATPSCVTLSRRLRRNQRTHAQRCLAFNYRYNHTVVLLYNGAVELSPRGRQNKPPRPRSPQQSSLCPAPQPSPARDGADPRVSGSAIMHLRSRSPLHEGVTPVILTSAGPTAQSHWSTPLSPLSMRESHSGRPCPARLVPSGPQWPSVGRKHAPSSATPAPATRIPPKLLPPACPAVCGSWPW